VHGLGEHSGRYDHVARALLQAGYAVVSFDLRGHGKSGGPRGHTPSFERLMEDIDLLMAEGARRYPGLPQFLYGHSLGGILVLNYALRRKPQIAGVVVTSPGLHTSIREQKAKVAFATALSGLFPTLSVPSGLDANGISHDPQVVRRYKEDPLVHGVGTLRMGTETFTAIDWAFSHAAEFSLPLLLMHGTEDPIAYFSGCQEFASQVKCDVTLKAWPGLYHELHNEAEQDQVFAYLIAWLETHRKTWEAGRRAG
jgi:alpha-beta hydrolase superfamily lysophospholipase